MIGFDVFTTRRLLMIQSTLLTAGITLSGLLPMPSLAQSNGTVTSADVPAGTNYVDLSGLGQPPTGDGDASRGCEKGDTETRMLAPYRIAEMAESEITGYHAMITDSQASLWMYVPYTLEEFESMTIFVWDEETESYVYKSELTNVGATPGVVGVTLPSEAIQVGKVYQWFVNISYRCDAEDGRLTSGTDQRKGHLEIGSWSETWYSTMVQAAQKRCTGETVSDWDTLLSDIHAAELATLPISACLSPANTASLED